MSKKKAKENPLMKEKKIKGIKNNIGASEEGNEVKNFIIIVIVLAVIVGVIYGITVLLNKEEIDYSYQSTAGAINYDIVSVGTILNRPYKDYYVLVYDVNKDESVKYNSILNSYMDKSKEDDYIKIYLCDLNNELNKAYYNVNDDNKSNPEASKTSEFDFGDITLLHIKKGKIVEYIEKYETIKEKLK